MKSNLKIYGAPILALVVVLAIFAFVVLPWVNGANGVLSLRQDIVAQRDLIDKKLKPKLDVLQAEDPNLLSQQLTGVVLSVPNEGNPPMLFRVIEKIGIDSQLNIEGIALSTGTDKTKTSETIGNTLRFSLRATGNYSSLLRFIEIIENSRPSLGVDGISVRSTGTNASLTIGLDLLAYYQGLPTLSADISSPVQKLNSTDISLLEEILTMPEYVFTPNTSNIGKIDIFE